MIAHVALLQPKPELSSSERAAFLEAFERAIRDIPEVRAVKVGARVTHSAGYEQGMPDADFLVVLDFDDLESLRSYLAHPSHQELGTLFGRYLSSALVYDFETGGTELLRRFT